MKAVITERQLSQPRIHEQTGVMAGIGHLAAVASSMKEGLLTPYKRLKIRVSPSTLLAVQVP
jgi:hypothetical protein